MKGYTPTKLETSNKKLVSFELGSKNIDCNCKKDNCDKCNDK